MEFVARVRAGDGPSLDVFVERMRCIPRILRHKNRRFSLSLGDADTDDLAQEVLAAVWDRLETFRGDSTLEAWVYSFCVQKLMNAMKRLSRRPILVEVPEDASAGGEASGAQQLEFGEMLAGLTRLTTEESDTIQLKHFEGLTFEEIAARLSISINTAKTRYYGGIDRLRQFLGANGSTEGEG